MRLTSDVTDTDFPFAEDSVPFILVFEDSGFGKDGRSFEHASTYEKKVKLLEQAMAHDDDDGLLCHVLAVWPGKTRSDVFLVDDLDQALRAMG